MPLLPNPYCLEEFRTVCAKTLYQTVIHCTSAWFQDFYHYIPENASWNWPDPFYREALQFKKRSLAVGWEKEIFSHVYNQISGFQVNVGGKPSGNHKNIKFWCI